MMIEHLSKATHVAIAVSIAVLSMASVVGVAAAADGKPSRSMQTKWLCSVWESDPEQYKACLKRNH